MEKSVYNALAIPEILDNILSYLPIRDLLSARSASKYWNGIGNQLLIKHHIPNNIKIHLYSYSEETNLQTFLQLSNSSSVSLVFRQLANFSIVHTPPSPPNDFLQDKPYYEEFLRKYCSYISCIELEDDCAVEVIEFLLQKENLSKCTNLQSLKISGNIRLEFLTSAEFDISGLAKLKRLEFGKAYNSLGHKALLTMLSRLTSTNLNSINLGCTDFNMLDLDPDILGSLFQNSPQLHSFQNYEVSDIIGNCRAKFLVQNSHLIAMTTDPNANGGCKLKDLKFIISTNFNQGLDPATFIRFLHSHSNSLESLTLRCQMYFDYTNFRMLWKYVLPKFPLLTRLDLPDCPNTHFLSQMPNLTKLRISQFIPHYLKEIAPGIICPSLKSLTMKALSWSYPNMDMEYNMEEHLFYLNNLVRCFPNVEKVVVPINQAKQNGGERKDLRLGLYLKLREMETLFDNSPAMEQLEYAQLKEADVHDLEISQVSAEPFVNMLLCNCTKFLALDEAMGRPLVGVPNQDLICLLSHGLSYKDMRSASTKSLDTNKILGTYGFIKVANSSSCATIAIGPRVTSRTALNNSKVLF